MKLVIFVLHTSCGRWRARVKRSRRFAPACKRSCPTSISNHASAPTSPKPARREAITLLERTTRALLKTSSTQRSGLAYAVRARPTRARGVHRALAANPRDVYAHENIGTVYLQQNDYAARTRRLPGWRLKTEPRSSRAPPDSESWPGSRPDRGCHRSLANAVDIDREFRASSTWHRTLTAGRGPRHVPI